MSCHYLLLVTFYELKYQLLIKLDLQLGNGCGKTEWLLNFNSFCFKFLLRLILFFMKIGSLANQR